MAKNRAKSRNLAFDIDPKFLFNLWKEQEGKCRISGLDFDLRKPDKFNDTRYNAPSLDRIIPEKGYIKGNVRLVLYQINAAMQQYGLEHFLTLCSVLNKNQAQVS